MRKRSVFDRCGALSPFVHCKAFPLKIPFYKENSWTGHERKLFQGALIKKMFGNQ
jgi:hypothetical protein